MKKKLPEIIICPKYTYALKAADVLSPQFDSPMKEAEAWKVLKESGIEKISKLSHHGLNVVGRRAAAALKNE